MPRWVGNQGVIGAAAELDREEIRNAVLRGRIRDRQAFSNAEFNAAAANDRGCSPRSSTSPGMARRIRRNGSGLNKVTDDHPGRGRAAEKVCIDHPYQVGRPPDLMPIISRSTHKVRPTTSTSSRARPWIRRQRNRISTTSRSTGGAATPGSRLAPELEMDKSVEGLREERSSRLHDPIRTQGSHPLVRAGLPSPPRRRPRTLIGP